MFPVIEPFVLRALQGEVIEEVEFTRPANLPGMADATNLVSYQPALDEAGEVIGISVAVVDISERKRAQQALIESCLLYTSVVRARDLRGCCRRPGQENQRPSNRLRQTRHR